MNKEQVLNKLLELYKHTCMFETDTRNFEDVARHINEIHDNNGILDMLGNYERFLFKVIEVLPVTELAKLCGISTRHCYRLLKEKSKLNLFLEYQYKNE